MKAEIITSKATDTHVTGIIIEHDIGPAGRSQLTGIKAEYANGQVRLNLKQGDEEIKIYARDWDFFKKQVEETLAKKRLITSK